MEPTTIRPYRESDLADLIRLADDPSVAANLRDAFPSPYTEADGRTWLSQVATMDPLTAFAIDHGGVFAGGIGYIPGRDVERVSAEVGYFVGRPYWGKGVATAALRELVKLLAARGDYTRLFALPFANNAASRRVLEKAGFSLDAVLRRAAVKGGVIVDQALYSLTLSEG